MSTFQLSLVIASQEPQKLAEFYAFATKGDLQYGEDVHHYLIVNGNGMHIQIYRPSKKRAWSNKFAATSLCLQQSPSIDPLAQIDQCISRLVLKGASVVEEPRNESFGAECWLSDPDGNHFLIFAPIIKK